MSMSGLELTKAEAGDRLGIGPKQLMRHVADGMPHSGSGVKIRFPWPAIRKWRDDFLVESGKRKATPTSIDEAELQLTAAKAQIEELKLEEMRKRLLKREDAAKWFEDACQRVRGHLLPLPQKLAPRVVGVRTTQEALAAIQPIVDEVMDELHRADDVAESAEPEDTEAE